MVRGGFLEGGKCGIGGKKIEKNVDMLFSFKIFQKKGKNFAIFLYTVK
jgi:hypothetical protein